MLETKEYKPFPGCPNIWSNPPPKESSNWRQSSRVQAVLPRGSGGLFIKRDPVSQIADAIIESLESLKSFPSSKEEQLWIKYAHFRGAFTNGFLQAGNHDSLKYPKKEESRPPTYRGFCMGKAFFAEHPELAKAGENKRVSDFFDIVNPVVEKKIQQQMQSATQPGYFRRC